MFEEELDVDPGYDQQASLECYITSENDDKNDPLNDEELYDVSDLDNIEYPEEDMSIHNQLDWMDNYLDAIGEMEEIYDEEDR